MFKKVLKRILISIPVLVGVVLLIFKMCIRDSSKSMVKGLISGALGLLLSTIGMDPMEGVQRFMFGQSSLYEGINVTCALIGLFSMSQALILAEKEIRARGTAKKFKDRMLLNKEEIKQIAPTVGRSWIIGNLIGILPGAGASIACFLGYNTSRQFSKHKEEFGHGSICLLYTSRCV